MPAAAAPVPDAATRAGGMPIRRSLAPAAAPGPASATDARLSIRHGGLL